MKFWGPSKSYDFLASLRGFGRETLNRVLRSIGLKIVNERAFNQIVADLNKVNIERYSESRNGFLFKFMAINENPRKILEYAPSSKSQLFQDLFVLEKFNWKSDGYFVEFGATNGKDLSNTYLLEKNFSWSGVLAEPGKNWHRQLHLNRNAYISEKCIWRSSGEYLIFNEAFYPEFSTIKNLTSFDGMGTSRESRVEYTVETISLESLLVEAKSPNFIDYLSIDTEGSELEILDAFDFSKYEFGILTVEHNHNSNESKLDDLLLKNGYIRVHREISDFDGWYINSSLNP